MIDNVTSLLKEPGLGSDNITRSHKIESYEEQIQWIVICTVCIILGLVVATITYFWDRRHQPDNIRRRKLRESKAKKKKEEKAIAAIKKEPIQVDQFLQKLRQKKLDKYLNFEVRAIVRNQEDFPCSISTHPDNVQRNAVQDVISYDHSVVRLEEIAPGDDSDYINASYIEGYHGDKEYIATQGPKGKALASFWHMVWQENVHCIVMATGLFENSVQQCDKYWGDVLSVHKYVQQGNIHIYMKDELEMSKLIIRTFHIYKDGCDEHRELKHFEMRGFTDEHTDPGFLLDVRRRVNMYMTNVPGPLIVHCRCGGGKTAVFIAVDFCLKQLESEKFVDIYSTVLHLRKFRQNMIRSLSQYRLIYDTLALYVQMWNTVIHSAQLPTISHKLLMKDSHTNITGFEREFQFLQEIVPSIPNGDCASGHRDENRNKSRDIMLLPPERARPYLQTMETSDIATDFINAVFIDGYHNSNNFVVTQWPMQNTINDIWRLLYDFKITSLVVLHENKYSRSFPCFWPKSLEEETRFGPIGVKYLGCQKYPHIIIRAFAIRKLPNTLYNDLLEKLEPDHVLVTIFDAAKEWVVVWWAENIRKLTLIMLNKILDQEFIKIKGLVQKMSVLPLIDLLTQPSETIIVKMYHYTSWHHREKTPLSTKSFLYMMSSVDEWQKKTNSMSPVCIMSKDGYSKCAIYCTLQICCDQLDREMEVDIFNTTRMVKKNRPQLMPTMAEYIYCYSYMSLIARIMQEGSPRTMVNSPNLIEGEVQHGYELLTGFENIWTAQSGASTTINGSYKNGVNSTLFHQSDSQETLEDSLTVDIPVSLENNTRASRKLTKSQSVTYGVRSGGYVGHNGFLVENNKRMSMPVGPLSAPAAPGHVWKPEFPKSQSLSEQPGKRQSFKRRPFLRQNAEEELTEFTSCSIPMEGTTMESCEL